MNASMTLQMLDIESESPKFTKTFKKVKEKLTAVVYESHRGIKAI